MKRQHSASQVPISLYYVVLVLAFVTLGSSVASADRCTASIDSQVRMSDVIFEGRLVSVRRSSLRFDIIALYKGEHGPRIDVRLNRRSIVLGERRIGDVFVIIAQRRRGHLYVVPCGNSGVLARVPETLRALARLGLSRRQLTRDESAPGTGVGSGTVSDPKSCGDPDFRHVVVAA